MLARRALPVLALGLFAWISLAGASTCGAGGTLASFRFETPAPGSLVAAGEGIEVRLELPADFVAASLRLYLDDTLLAPTVAGNLATVVLPPLGDGNHRLFAWVSVSGIGPFNVVARAESSFDALTAPAAGCEELNSVECMLPYPSSRFLAPAATPTGYRLELPAEGMPAQLGPGSIPKRKSPEPYRVLDGFSPTVQVLMHFPGGIDLEVSDAPRLLSERRGTDERSLEADSPTLLIDAETGERILHFIENDARASNPDRVVTFLRPGKSLTPGRRYIVAARNLKHADGSAVEAEPVFRALRDDAPIAIASIEARKPAFEDLFAKLAQAGVARGDLVLAFDFVTQSDHGLTHQMLSMRDQAFGWLDSLAPDVEPFTVTKVTLKDDCSSGVGFHSEVQGTFQVPLFLSGDPITASNTFTVLNVDADQNPVWDGATFTNPPFTIAIPCSAVAGENPQPKRGVVIGHGLFGTGRGFVRDLIEANVFDDIQLVAGATDWRGLSSGDIDPLSQSFVVNQVLLDLDHFRALPDRLRQGQLNTLVLARMMRTGIFNRNEAFQAPGGQGVLSDELLNYVGGSLGGIMGTMFAALTPDALQHNLIVPAMNFSCMLQRATPFILFQDLLLITGLTDPMMVALGLQIIHELWVRGEPAGYVTHVTSNPLAGVNPKNVLISQAYLDQQVSNQCTEIQARTMNVPSLVGSNRSGMPQIPDVAGPLTSAYVEYDTGSFSFGIPEHAPFIPPLANLQATPSGCDPHGLQGFIPASVQQLATFFADGGISNFCSGPGSVCDTISSPGDLSELPKGEAACDPLAD